MPKLCYHIHQKIKSRKQQEKLFKQGRNFLVYPVKVSYLIESITIDAELNNQPVFTKVGVGVSKRYFKRANKRNYIKRLLREAYRINQDKFEAQNLSIAHNQQLILFFNFISNELPTYPLVEAKILVIAKKLAQHITNQQ